MFATESIEAALQHCERMRPHIPPLYNSVRKFEEPIPRIDLTTCSNEQDDDFSSIYVNEQNNDLPSTFYDSGGKNESSELDVKPVIEEDGDDLIAYAQLFGNGSIATATATANNKDPLPFDDQQANVSTSMFSIDSVLFANNIQCESTPIPEAIANTTDSIDAHQVIANQIQDEIVENTQRLLLYGEQVVIDDELEFIHIPNQTLRAIKSVPKYEVKSNDIVCGNKPFKEDVCIAFAHN